MILLVIVIKQITREGKRLRGKEKRGSRKGIINYEWQLKMMGGSKNFSEFCEPLKSEKLFVFSTVPCSFCRKCQFLCRSVPCCVTADRTIIIVFGRALEKISAPVLTLGVQEIFVSSHAQTKYVILISGNALQTRTVF